MRESEEYLEDSIFDLNEISKVLELDDAEHAVKLAYKEGYLKAIEDAYDSLWGYTELSSSDVEEIIEELKKEFKG